MAKVLISSVGVGNKKDGGYQTATYEYEGKRQSTPFISKALVEFLAIDRLFLLGTRGSIWDSVYAEFGGEDEEIELTLWDKKERNSIDEEDLRIVQNQIDNFLGATGSRCFLIEYGINEEELWKNFGIYLKILDHLQKGDEVYIDITHSFRSLALFGLVMTQFGHTIKEKNFKIAGILYGMFEYKHHNNGITPIVDLKILYDLIEWMKAIENLTQYGNADKIVKLLGGDEELKEERKIFNNFSLSLRMANLASIKKNINSLDKKLKIIQNSSNPIISLLSEELIDFVQRLNKEKLSDFQLAIAEWFCEHKHYALGYVALVESIVTKVCERKGYATDEKEARDRAKREISQIDNSLYYKIYQSANKIRNDICHQIGKRETTLLNDANNLERYIQKTKEIFERLERKG